MVNRVYKKSHGRKITYVIMIALLLLTNFMSSIPAKAESGVADLTTEETVEENSNVIDETHRELLESTEENKEISIENETVEDSSGTGTAEDAQRDISTIVPATSFAMLRDYISRAPRDGTRLNITISNNITMADTLTIPEGANIQITSYVPTTMYSLKNNSLNTLFIVNNSSLTLGNGVSLTRAIGIAGTSPIVDVRGGGTFTMTSGSNIRSMGTAVGVTGSNSTFIMERYSAIWRDDSSSASTVIVSDGNFRMIGGSIESIDPRSVSAVRMSGNSAFTMTGGSIEKHSNGVEALGSSTFTMNGAGAAIQNNRVIGNGGGIYAGTNSTVKLEKGSINNNTATGNGGGIYTEKSSYSNLSVSSSMSFSNNQAGTNYTPPINAASAFPNIKTTAAVSVHNHPLNNADINFTTGRTLTVARNITAGGDVMIEGNKNFTSGTVAGETGVTVVAEPAPGYIFTGWTTSNGGTFANQSSASTTFTMPNNNTTITAHFEREGRRFIDIFLDRNLAQVVAGFFSRGVEDYVTDDELQEVKSLNGNGKGIINLQGIENLSKLQNLQLSDNKISSSSMIYLTQLDNLDTLELNSTGISNLSEFSKMGALVSLQMDNNGITDISALSNLTRLEDLTLNNNKIEDIDPLRKLTGLQNLQMENNGIKDISVLSNLTGLRLLRLNTNQISDLRPLKYLSRLDSLSVRDQTVYLESGVIGSPTDLDLYNISGTEPTVTMDAGEYKNGSLTWYVSGDNSLSWSENSFSGTVVQTVIPGTTLMFESVPDNLEFEDAPIQNSAMTIKRKEPNLSLSVKDTRGEGSTWQIRVAVNGPFTSVEDKSHRLPEDILFFKDSNGVTQQLSSEQIEVYRGTTERARLITEVSWEEDEGIFMYMQTVAARPGTQYETTITWTLQDAP